MKQQKHHRVFLSIFAVLVFSIYLSADLLNSLHSSLLHQQITEEGCTLEQEENTCHRAIYHQDVENGCDHTEHFVPQVVDCALCSIILHRHTFLKAEISLIQNIEIVSTISRLEPTTSPKPFHYSYLLRGPPIFS